MSKQAPLAKMDIEQARETALVDLAYGILRETNQPIYFRDLMQDVAKLRKMTEAEINETIAMLYTEINIDGRFLCIGNNVWGLKRWYPVDKTTEKSSGGKKFVRKDADFDDDDDELYIEDEELDDEELTFDNEEIDGDLEGDDVDVDEDLEDFGDDELIEDADEELDETDKEEDEDF